MQNTNNALNNFPTNAQEYNADKPINLTLYQWLFDPTNPYYFPFWVSVVINKIHWASLMRGWTFFKQKNLPALLPESVRKCVDTLSITLNRLVAINALEMKVAKKNKQYRVNWELLRSTNIPTVNNPNPNVAPTMIRTIFDENITESPFDTVIYEDENFLISEEFKYTNRSYNHVDDLSDPKISWESDKAEPPQAPSEFIELEPLEVEIKKEFEAITGKPLNLKKNLKTLKELKELAKEAKDVVMLALRNIANHCAEKGTKVYNLAYVLTAVKNLMAAKSSPKNAPLDYVAASERDKAYAATGGDPAKNRLVEPILTPEQKAEDLKALHLQLKHHEMREEFFNSLPEQDKEKFIELQIEDLKTKPIWEKLKPIWPWFDMAPAITYAVERVKNFLLQDHLDHQEFLVSQASG